MTSHCKKSGTARHNKQPRAIVQQGLQGMTSNPETMSKHHMMWGWGSTICMSNVGTGQANQSVQNTTVQ